MINPKLTLITALAASSLFLTGCAPLTAPKINTNTASVANANAANTNITVVENTPKKLLIKEYDTTVNKEKGVFLLDPATTSTVQLSNEPYEFQGYYGKNIVFKNTEDQQYYKYDLLTQWYTVLNFPVAKQDGDYYEQVSVYNHSIGSTDKLIVVVTNYNVNDEVNEMLGSRPARDIKRYAYDFLSDTYTAYTFINDAEKLLPTKPKTPPYAFIGSDSTDTYAFFQMSGEGIGCSTITAVNLTTNTTQSVEQNDSLQGADVGCLHVNADLNRGFYVLTDRAHGAIANVVSLDDISNPLSQVQLNAPNQNTNSGANFYNFSSLEWLSGSKVALGSDHVMAVVDFDEHSMKDIYTDQQVGGSYMAWDRNTIKFNGDDTVAFVDYYSAKYVECAPGGTKKCPSHDKTDSRYRVILQNLSDNSQKIFLDDATSKEIIGWY